MMGRCKGIVQTRDGELGHHALTRLVREHVAFAMALILTFAQTSKSSNIQRDCMKIYINLKKKGFTVLVKYNIFKMPQ